MAVVIDEWIMAVRLLWKADGMTVVLIYGGGMLFEGDFKLTGLVFVMVYFYGTRNLNEIGIYHVS